MQGGNEYLMIIAEFYCTPATFLGSFNFSEKRIHPIPSRLETAARWPSDYAVGRKPRLRDRTLVGDGFETVTLAHWPFLTREPSLCLVNSADREARMSQSLWRSAADWLQHPSRFNFSFSHQRDPTKGKRKGINAFPTDKCSLTVPRIRFLLSDGSFLREFSSTRGYIVAKCLATSMVAVLRPNFLVKMNNFAKYKLCSNLPNSSSLGTSSQSSLSTYGYWRNLSTEYCFPIINSLTRFAQAYDTAKDLRRFIRNFTIKICLSHDW